MPAIVGFSAVWANSSKQGFISGVPSQLPDCAWDENKNPLKMGSGVFLLSRFPLSDIFTKYEKLVGWDSVSQKGFLLATVEIEAQKLLIAHTQADDGGAADAGQEARKSNILELQSGISKAADISTPVILLGDLNIIGEDKSGIARANMTSCAIR